MMINSYRCVKCQHEWTPRKSEPKTCPKCRTTLWRDKDAIGEIPDVLDDRITIYLLVRPETKKRTEQWKKNNPDLHWDVLLDIALKGTNIPRNRCQEIIDHQTP